MSLTTTERVAQSNELPAETLRELYRTMFLVRALDQECIALQRQGVLPAYAPERGQEAAQVGCGAAIDPRRDFAFPTYREFGVAVAMGVDPVDYIASHKGVWHGGMYDPMATHFGSLNAIVGGPVLHGVGWAMGAKLDGKDAAAVSFFGDGASSQGDVHEAMNFAGVFQLPVVFFCQNNGWAISVPTASQVAGGSVAARAAGYGMPGVQVDGNDVVAVHLAVRDALERARGGGGPTVIEAMTYRAGPHSTSDDPGRYRSLEEEQSWIARDPLTLFEARLRAEGVADDAFFAETTRESTVRVEEVRAGVEALGGLPGEEMFNFVFAAMPQGLEEQKRAWRAAAAIEGGAQ